MKQLRIGTRLVLVFLFCVILSAIIGVAAIANIAKIRRNITEIKLCKNIEIEILECRRQEKNILLLGPDEKSTLEEKEEKTYLEKINDNLLALRGLAEEAKKRITSAAQEELNAITVELNNYKISLKRVEDNFKERKTIIEDLETNFKALQELSQVQDNLPEKNLPIISDVHIRAHHYIAYHKNEYINKAKSGIEELKKIFEDKENILLLGKCQTLINALMGNNEVIDANILSMRKSGRRIQQLALKIRAIVEKKVEVIEQRTTLTVRLALILAVLFTGIIGVFFIQSITSPIRKLAIATTVIAKGDLSYRVAIESADEIGELGRLFNKMAEDLEKTTVLKEYVDNILESMMDSLIVFSPDGEIRRANKAACELLGYREEELSGMPARQLFGREIFLAGEKLNKSAETCYLKNYELACLSKDKVNIPVLFNASIMRNPKGKIAGIIGEMKDMRELKNLREKLARAENLAALGRFSAIISHEFKNELCVIQNAVYFLGMKLQNGDEKIKKQINLLTEEIAETGRMIDNIASFAKNRFLELKPVNLEALLISAIKKAQIPDTINVLAKIEKDLPPVKADEIQLARVFNNIILNSLQAMAEKGSLIIKAIRLDNGVNIVFEDTGSGIKEEDTKKIFDPFFSTKNRGMGLGLVASKVIIEAHNGSIDIINNKTGKGAMVTIQLPIKERKNA